MRFQDTSLLRCRILGGENTVIDRWWCQREADLFWRIYRNRDPGGEIIHDQGRLILEPDCFYVIPARIMFKGRCQGLVRHDYLHFQISGLPSVWLKGAATAIIRLDPEDWWHPLFDRLGQTWYAADLLRLQALLHLAVGQVLAETDLPAAHAQSAALIAPALRLISEQLASPPSVARLASLCGISPDHLARCFMHVYSSTPARWIQQQRIAQAADRLAEGGDIDAVATRLGFANRTHFSRVFRRVTGTTPAAYRKRIQRLDDGT